MLNAKTFVTDDPVREQLALSSRDNVAKATHSNHNTNDWFQPVKFKDFMVCFISREAVNVFYFGFKESLIL